MKTLLALAAAGALAVPSMALAGMPEKPKVDDPTAAAAVKQEQKKQGGAPDQQAGGASDGSTTGKSKPKAKSVKSPNAKDP